MKLSQMFLYLAAAAAIAWGAGVSDVTPPTLTAISFSPARSIRFQHHRPSQ